MNDCEDGFASAEVVIEFCGDVDAIVRYEEEVVRILNGSQSFCLGNESFEFDGIAKAQEGFAIGQCFDVSDEAEMKTRTQIGR